MKYTFIHISDIHYREGCPEQRPAFKPFLSDLEKQIQHAEGEVYVVVSGDVAYAADEHASYNQFGSLIEPLLLRAGLGAERRICVPGNHDVSRSAIRSNDPQHDALVSYLQNGGEAALNKISDGVPAVLREVFDRYCRFEEGFANYGVRKSLVGQGHTIDESLGVYCLNSALLSRAGLAGADGIASDKRRLGIATRPLAAWLEESSHKTRLLVSHHPFEWLSDWAQAALKEYLPKFSLVLTGHEHSAEVSAIRRSGAGWVELAAPALLTDRRTPMGYAFSSVSNDGSISVRYREWSQIGVFVSGSRMAGTDDGVVSFTIQANGPTENLGPFGVASRFFAEGLQRTLRAFGKSDLLPWIEPQIYDLSETDRTRAKAKRWTVDEIAESGQSFVISSPPQYGLTGLSWHLCTRAIALDPSRAWVRLDMEMIKPHDARAEIASILKTFGYSPDQLGGVVVDSWAVKKVSPDKFISAIHKAHPTAAIILLESRTGPALDSITTQFGDIVFRHLHLWAQNRTGMRALIEHFREKEGLDIEVESLLGRVVQDLNALNLPRTPLNCLTLLLVSPASGDPLVNRAEVIKRILSIIFESEASLTYRSRADKTDCEHLLGSFAERLIRDGSSWFSRKEFIQHGTRYCSEMLVDVDVEAVLDLLMEHDIVIASSIGLAFRFSYWVYYFAAARMLHSSEFRDYIFSDMQYTRFPEVVEFYAGIDRRRADALRSLTCDLMKLNESIRSKANVPPPSHLYKHFRWSPDASNAEEMMRALESDVLDSSLPQEVKDRYADRGYDAARTHDQEIRSILRAYSFESLTAGLRASARALRNSDYVHPEVKGALFDSVMNSWEQVQTVLVLISPLLAEKGRAVFDGTEFVLAEDDVSEERATTAHIWSFIPYNVISWFRDDLCSAKIGPLLIERLKKELDPLKKYNIALLICAIRPARWKTVVEDYIAEVPRESFYLYDLGHFLASEYRFGYLASKEREQLAHVVRSAYAKIYYGNNRPSEQIKKMVQIPGLSDGLEDG